MSGISQATLYRYIHKKENIMNIDKSGGIINGAFKN
jgi:hypothetical protein